MRKREYKLKVVVEVIVRSEEGRVKEGMVVSV